jgi:hypothetical protein
VLAIGIAAVFLAKNTRLTRQKCSQGVQACCAFFLAFGHFLLKKPLRKPNANTPWRRTKRARFSGCLPRFAFTPFPRPVS